MKDLYHPQYDDIRAEGFTSKWDSCKVKSVLSPPSPTVCSASSDAGHPKP